MRVVLLLTVGIPVFAAQLVAFALPRVEVAPFSLLRRVAETIRKAEDTRWKRTNPEGLARAQAAVDQLNTVIGKLQADLAKATAKGDEKAARTAQDSIDARREWLAGAEAALAEFSGE